MEIFAELARREREGRPVRVAVVGTGYFGAGLIRRLAAIPGLQPVVAANRTLARATDALRSAGFAEATIRARSLVCPTAGTASDGVRSGKSQMPPTRARPMALQQSGTIRFCILCGLVADNEWGLVVGHCAVPIQPSLLYRAGFHRRYHESAGCS